MATKQAHKRLTKEYKMMVENPPPYIMARPNESNILEWHYIITGPPDTPYENGQYHGTLTFPSDYPYKPPAIRMITPNGRFKENTRLCLSMSDYHPDSWNPGWSVATILNGLLSFMTGKEETTGSITSSERQKRFLAWKSLEYNTQKSSRFSAVFPDIVEENLKELQKRNSREDKGSKDFGLSSEKHWLGNGSQDDVIAQAAKENVVPLEEIVDPEDRIRAEEALKDIQGQEARKEDPQGPFNSTKYIVAAVFLFLLGLSMK